MKKTLQINLGGITFNIEEDAFEKLNLYLESVKKYFSSYEGSSEIVADIEARIAEKFYTKTQQNGVVELDDVSRIITSMGTVDDFESVKEDEDLIKEAPNTEESKSSDQAQSEDTGSRKAYSRFYRDGKGKALGGVLSGLAHYLEADVVWFRILFIVLAFGLIETGIGGFLFIAYLVAWVAMPERNDLEENKKIKKFYRNPENKVLGGVASGLAAYLNLDLVVVRIIMVISAGFFGIGILLYIVFWIVVPNANTLTQKMELQGQPVTLENIETNIKSQNVGAAPKSESSLAKLLLFPFRLIGIVIGALGKLVRPAGALLRIFAGLLLFVLGVAMGLSLIVSLGVILGFLVNSPFISGITNDHVVSIFLNDMPEIGVFFVFLAAFVPALVLTIIGLGLITGKSFVNSNFWQTTLILWLVGLVGSAAIGSKYAMNFSNKAGYSTETNLKMPSGTLWLDMVDDEFYDNDNFESSFGRNRVQIQASENQNLYMRVQYLAKGSSKKIATENAKNMKYNFKQVDSVIVFDNKITFLGKKQFRDQHAEAILYIPKNRKFKMTERFFDNGYSNSWHLSDQYAIDYDKVEKFTFILNEEGKIECLDCPRLTESEKQSIREFDGFRDNFFEDGEFENHGEHSRTFNVKDFRNLDFGSNFIVRIKRGDEYEIKAYSDHTKELEDIDVKVENSTLRIKYDDPFENHDGRINIEITMPDLEELEISGAAAVKVIGFEREDKMNIILSGASKLALQADVQKLDIESSGASKILAKGKAESLDLEMSGACMFFGKELELKKANVEASGASKGEFGKVPDFSSNISGGSIIDRD